MTRKFPILYTTRDLDQHVWRVKQERETKHGFNLLFGSPESCLGANRGSPLDLPAGRTARKRVRSRLGFHWHNDADKFYAERADDLANLSDNEFALKHSINHQNALSGRRMQILGRRARQLGWWRKPKTIKLLCSDLTLREIGEKLGISTSQVFRLRQAAGWQPPSDGTPGEQSTTTL